MNKNNFGGKMQQPPPKKTTMLAWWGKVKWSFPGWLFWKKIFAKELKVKSYPHSHPQI